MVHFRFQDGNNLVFHPVSRFIDSNEFQCVARSLDGDVYFSESAQFNIKCKWLIWDVKSVTDTSMKWFHSLFVWTVPHCVLNFHSVCHVWVVTIQVLDWGFNMGIIFCTFTVLAEFPQGLLVFEYRSCNGHLVNSHWFYLIEILVKQAT